MVTRIAAKIKQLFTPRPAARPARPALTLFQALDLSLARGYSSVNWQGWQ